MASNFFVYFIENIVFWVFVYFIVFLGCETPAIVFTGFGFFLFYWILRFIFSKEGIEAIVWLYAFNMFITILLLYYFITGSSLQKSLRSAMNSAAKRYPQLEPYFKRC